MAASRAPSPHAEPPPTVSGCVAVSFSNIAPDSHQPSAALRCRSCGALRCAARWDAAVSPRAGTAALRGLIGAERLGTALSPPIGARHANEHPLYGNRPRPFPGAPAPGAVTHSWCRARSGGSSRRGVISRRSSALLFFPQIIPRLFFFPFFSPSGSGSHQPLLSVCFSKQVDPC